MRWIPGFDVRLDFQLPRCQPGGQCGFRVESGINDHSHVPGAPRPGPCSRTAKRPISQVSTALALVLTLAGSLIRGWSGAIATIPLNSLARCISCNNSPAAASGCILRFRRPVLVVGYFEAIMGLTIGEIAGIINVGVAFRKL